MPVLETAKRQQALQVAEARRDQLVEALRDEDWVERLSQNDDFKKFVGRIKVTQEETVKHREDIVASLTKPLKSPDVRAEFNEGLMVASAVISATNDILNWPSEQTKRLKEARKELPGLEKNIKNLGGK